MMKTVFAVLAAVTVAGAAMPGPVLAQYYPPPPGYGGPPPYYPPPPPPRGRFGQRCDSIIQTPYGPEHMICPIVEPKPLGYECACPAPRRSGYRPGSFVPGRTIR